MWSNVELQLGLMMTAFLGEVAIPTVAVYIDLLAFRTRIAALRAAAEWTINKEQYSIFQALIYLAQKSTKKRDRLAHHIWTYTDDLPEDLLLIDPRDMLPAFTVGVGKMLRSEIIDGRLFTVEDVKIEPEKVFVYKCKDFDEIYLEFLQLVNYIMKFNEMVLREDVSEQFQIYHALSAQPLIREFLDRQNASQSAPATPPTSPKPTPSDQSEPSL